MNAFIILLKQKWLDEKIPIIKLIVKEHLHLSKVLGINNIGKC